MGPQTIEEMKTLAVEMFSDIQYNGEAVDSSRFVHTFLCVLSVCAMIEDLLCHRSLIFLFHCTHN